jgi:hypothetical protein
MSNFISTSKLSRARGFDPKDAFKALHNNDFIKRGDDDKCWVLTDKGKKLGGGCAIAKNGGKYVVWPEDIEFPFKINNNRPDKDSRSKNKGRQVAKYKYSAIDFTRIDFTKTKSPDIYWAIGHLSCYSKTIQSKIKELEEKGSIQVWETDYNSADYIFVKFLFFNEKDFSQSKFYFWEKIGKKPYYDSYDEDPYAHGWSLEEEMDYYGYEGPKNDLVAYENWRDIQN